MKAALTTLVLVAAILVGLHLWLIDGIDGWLWSLTMPEDTVYTPGYSDSGFRAVKVGMTEAEVHRLLGPPQTRWSLGGAHPASDLGERWSYSPGDTNFRCRVVLFSRGRAVEKHAEFYVD